jgi:molybdopterin-guanine dinucleotide biosynthesis protein A
MGSSNDNRSLEPLVKALSRAHVTILIERVSPSKLLLLAPALSDMLTCLYISGILNMTSIILAGGKSSRLGHSKALQLMGGKILIQWVIDRLGAISTEIIIATAHGEEIPYSSTVTVKTVSDIHHGKGPLAGIYSGLIASSNSSAIVVSCDTPFLSVSLLKYMTRICSKFDVVVPRIELKTEPLCAVYSKTCLAPIEELLKRNELKIIKLFPMVRVRYVEEHEIDTFDPDHLSFFNINSQDDLDRARTLATAKGWLLRSS